MIAAEQIKAASKGRELEILRSLTIKWPPQMGRHINCPFPGHVDKNPSWRWDAYKGCYFCTCGAGDLIDIVQKIHCSDFRAAIIYIADELGATH